MNENYFTDSRERNGVRTVFKCATLPVQSEGYGGQAVEEKYNICVDRCDLKNLIVSI